MLKELEEGDVKVIQDEMSGHEANEKLCDRFCDFFGLQLRRRK